MYSRVEGAERYYIRCINPRRNKWAISWDFQPAESGGENLSYEESVFDHRPSIDEIRETILAYYNDQTDNKIRDGFVFKGSSVCLSMENQFNYKAAYDLAVQTHGASLPVRFKFGPDSEPDYHDFTTVEELSEFYTSAILFIQNTLAEGWAKKDSVDFNQYAL